MKFACLLLVATSLVACQPEFEAVNPYQFVGKDLSFFSSYINSGKVSSSQAEKTTLSNDRYPIYLTLYTDGNFYYDLPTLGDGTGTWKHEEGHLELYAERKLFAMSMGIHKVKEDQGNLVIHFVDRFGTQYLPLTVEGR